MTRTQTPEFGEAVGRLPANLDPVTRFMAMDYLRTFAKPEGQQKIPEDVAEQRAVSAIRTLSPGMSVEEAQAAHTARVTPKVLSPEERQQEIARRTFNAELKAGQVLDPETGKAADGNTASGALAIANEARQRGLKKEVADGWEKHATSLKSRRDEQQRQRAETAATPVIQAARGLMAGGVSEAQRTELAAAIGEVEADPVKGLPRLQAAAQNIQRSQEGAKVEERRATGAAQAEERRAAATEQRRVESEHRIRHIDALTDKALQGGSEGNAARLQLNSLRATTAARRTSAQRQLDTLTDPVRIPGLGMDPEARKSKVGELRQTIEDADKELGRIQERQQSAAGLSPPARQAQREQLSRQDPRYKAARQRGISDEQLRAKYNLDLVP